MPNIRSYNAPSLGVSTLRPNNSGADAVQFAGRTAERMADQTAGQLSSVGRGQERAAQANAVAMHDVVKGVGEVADAVAYEVAQHQERQELTKFYADTSSLTNTMTSAWNETRAKADLNDPTVAQKFNEDVLSPALNDLTQAYHTPRGQQMAAEFAGRMSEHFFTKQTADMATAAGEAAVRNVTTAANQDADTLMKDPSSYEFINEMARERIAGLKRDPNLAEEHRAHLDELERKTLYENTVAAVHGMASKNPAAAKAALANGFGADALDATQRSTLTNYADTVQRMNEERDRAAEAKVKRDNVTAATGIANKLLADHLKPDGKLDVGPDFFEGIKAGAGMQDSPDGLWRSMYEMGTAALKREQEHAVIVTDPQLFQSFAERAITPETDPKKLTMMEINDANAKGLIDDKDTQRLREYLTVEDPQKKAALTQFNNVLNSYKQTIAPTSALGVPASPQEQAKWGQLQTDARDAFEQAYSKGNWRSAITAGAKDYIFNDLSGYMKNGKGRLKEFSTNVQQGITPMTTPTANPVGAPKGAAPRGENESPDEYLKRTGG